MLACQKEHFFLPDDLHYLNCAYMSPTTRAIEAAGVEGLRRKRVPSQTRSDDFFRETDRVRALFAHLINASADRIAIIPAASYGIATVAANTTLGAQHNVVVAAEQFPSNVYAWQRRCADAGAELRLVGVPKEVTEGRARCWNERLLEVIDPRTAVVALGHVHWTDGTLFDLAALRSRTTDVGAALVIDGTQSVGALPFDVAALQPDALICASYKWLLGPYGLGLAYYGPRYDGGRPLEENWITRAGSEHFGGLVDYTEAYQPGAVRYDVGERSHFALMPMLSAALEHLIAWDPAAIQAYTQQLFAPVLSELADLGLWMEAPERRSHHLFGIRLPDGIDVNEVREALQRRNISVSVRGTSLRVSPHVYNTADDAAALVEALAQVRANA